MKMLQIPTAQLEQRIKEELETNPALEEGQSEEESAEEAGDNQSQTEETPTANETPETEEAEAQEEESKLDDEVDITDYYDDEAESVADYKTEDPNEVYDPDDDNKSVPVSVGSTFHEYLESQVGLMDLDDRQRQIAMHLIGSIDDDGYLRRDPDAIVDDLVFRQNINTDVKELEQILGEIQKLDPPGVGARTLEECLLLQLKRKEDPTIYTEMAIRVLEKYFELFAKKHYDKLENIFGIESDKLKKVVEEITRLNPKPGGSYSGNSGEAQITIIPDFVITNNNGELVLTLNGRNAPELRISNHFREMINQFRNTRVKSKSQKEAILFVKQKIDSAKWFIEAIQSRYNTMLLTMNAIMEYQREYFLTGDETRLKPMILKDIADKTGLDISTISRVANSKYVQTEFGTISLKYFFSESMTTESGEEVSTHEVKKILNDLIGAESKTDPISDQKLTEELNQRGYNIARRTVAKYREQLNIPVARLRKEL